MKYEWCHLVIHARISTELLTPVCLFRTSQKLIGCSLVLTQASKSNPSEIFHDSYRDNKNGKVFTF